MKNVVIFASGEGSNAERIIEFFNGNASVRITWVISNNENAGVIKRAQKYRKGVQIISKFVLENYTEQLIDFLTMEKTDLIVLAGFLLKIPEPFVDAFPDRIINIHPSLLPKHGGQGMYGRRVHEAVIEAKDKESGITIHYVNSEYDQGNIIFQKSCSIDTEDTVEILAIKIRELEHQFLPTVIEQIANQLKSR